MLCDRVSTRLPAGLFRGIRMHAAWALMLLNGQSCPSDWPSTLLQQPSIDKRRKKYRELAGAVERLNTSAPGMEVTITDVQT